MRVTSRRFLPSKQLYEIKLASGEKLWVRPEDFDVVQDDRIAPAQLRALVPNSEYLHARDYAMRLLARREFFQRELKDRLFKKGFAGRTIGRVLAELAAESYQDDDRAARGLIGERLARGGIGPRKLLSLLLQKGYERARAGHLLSRLVPANFEQHQMRKFISRRAQAYREQMARELSKLLDDHEKRDKMGGEAGIRFRLRAKYRGKIYTKLRAAGFSSEIASQTAKEIIPT